MNFTVVYTNKSKRYSIGMEEESGRPYISFPVSNCRCDYEEYYAISEKMYNCFPENIPVLEIFINECKERKHDSKLFCKPGSDRGSAS